MRPLHKCFLVALFNWVDISWRQLLSMFRSLTGPAQGTFCTYLCNRCFICIVCVCLFGFYNKIDTIEIRKKYRLLSRSQFVCCCRIRAVAMQRISFSRRCRFFFQFLIQIDRNRIGSIPKPHMMRVTASCTTRTVYARATFSLNCFILIRLRSIAISVSDIVNRPTSLFFSPATIPTCN